MSHSDEPRAENPDSSADTGEEPGAGAEPSGDDDFRGAEPVAAGAPAGRRKVVLVSAAAVVVLAVAGLVVYLLTSGDDSPDDTAGPDVPIIEGSAPTTGTIPSSQSAGSTPPMSPRASASSSVTAAPPPQAADAVAAESVAEQAASAISSADVTTLAELSCDPSSVGTEETFPANARAEVVGEPQIDGDTATVDIRLTIEGAEPTTVPIPLTRLDGRWCIP